VSAELLDRRALGAVRFVDAVTGLAVDAPVRVRAEGVRWIRNPRGWWVVASSPGLEAHAAAFAAPPAQPPVGSVRVELVVEDPSGKYLARRAALALPRDPNPDPAKAKAPGSLFLPQDVPLFRAPAAAVAIGWATVRASVAKGGTPLSGALLRLVRKGGGGKELGRGMTDARGEALVAAAGIPATTFEEGQGGVLATEVEARLEVRWKDAGSPPDPDALAALASLASKEVKLASGRTITIRVDAA
jgi:hypothetical protein